MTWVKLSDTFCIQPRWDALSMNAFATHVAALCDCAQKLTDGHITARAVRRLPIAEDPAAAADELVAAGVWEVTEDGYRIVDYLDDQEAADAVRERLMAKQAYDREFSRDRRAANPLGMRVDEYRAKQAAAAGMTVSQWLASQRDGRTTSYGDRTGVVPPDPSSPVPTRPEGKGRERGGGATRVATRSPGGSLALRSPASGLGPVTIERQPIDLDDEYGAQ